MAIKSKKWKTIVSFGAFALGVSLLLVNGNKIGGRLLRYAGSEEGIAGIFEQDYQNTSDFRYHVEDRLSDFLVMGAGGELGWYGESQEYGYDVFYNSAEDILVNYDSAATTSIVEGASDWEDNTAETEDDSDAKLSGKSSKDPAESNREKAEKFHEYLKSDKNMLYRITCDGEELYSNMEEGQTAEWGTALPEGYNFILYFDGNEVKIQKDGVEADVYGDGYYREEKNDWYVPGYKNFTVDEDTKKIQVMILAAKNPINYSYAKYNENGYVWGDNTFYYLAEKTGRHYREIKTAFAGLLTGIGLFAIFLLLHRGKKEADAALARITGKIWFEGKVLLWGVTVIAGCSVWAGYFGYYGEIPYELGYAVLYSGYGMGDFFSGTLQEILYFISTVPGYLLFLFWTIYLTVNDVKKNRETFFNGIVYRFGKAFETKNLKMPFSRRMVRRFLPVFLISAALSAAALLFALYADKNGITYPAVVFVVGILAFAGFLFLCFWYLSKVRQQAEEMDALTAHIQAIHDGDYAEHGKRGRGSELLEAAVNLEEIKQGMEQAVEERIKSERMKVELVANVSHDIKTPLTSIISYVQFLKQEENLPEHVKDYIRILDEKSERLKNMVQDVFSVSKAASGQLPVELEELDFGKLLRQTLADMDGQISSSPVMVKAEIPEHAILIRADGQRMYRVFQNLLQNALKYSLEGSRVFITLKEDASLAVASIKNTSRSELAGDLDFTERFMRGDESRTDGGSGLGLSIAKSFTEACGGTFQLEMIADLFVVTVAFPKTEKGLMKADEKGEADCRM